MRRSSVLASISAAAIGLALVGCARSTLSPGETSTLNYPMLMYAGSTPIVGGEGAAEVHRPMRVAVAQVGEIAPPQSMLHTLRGRGDLFRRVEPLSGIFSVDVTDDQPHRYDPAGQLPEQNAPADSSRDRLNRMRSIAAGMGMDYLLLFGGTVDHGNKGTALSILNLTIVGAFIVPGTLVHVEGKAAGSLIDVKTGQLLANFSSDTKGNGLCAAAFTDDVENASVQSARDELITKLTQDVLTQLTDISRPGPAR